MYCNDVAYFHIFNYTWRSSNHKNHLGENISNSPYNNVLVFSLILTRLVSRSMQVRFFAQPGTRTVTGYKGSEKILPVSSLDCSTQLIKKYRKKTGKIYKINIESWSFLGIPRIHTHVESYETIPKSMINILGWRYLQYCKTSWI